jgi:hypothetical protein
MWTARSIVGGLLAAFALVTVTQTAAADSAAGDRAIRLTWRAPPECPSGGEVIADARSLVIHREALEEGTPITVDAVVGRVAGDRWTLTLAVGGAKQRLEASTCADLARAGALFLALLMDPESVSSMPAPAPKPPAPPAPAPSAAHAASTSASKPTTAPPAPEIAVDSKPEGATSGGEGVPSMLAAAGIAVDLGTLPHAGVFGVIAGGVRIRRFDIMLEGAVAPPEDTSVDGAAGARLMAASATLKPCYAVLTRARVRLEPCLPIELGWIHGQGIGIAQSGSSDSFWWSLGGAIALWLDLGSRLEARVDVVALAPLVRPNFTLTGLGSVFTPGIAVRPGATAVIRF